MLLLALAVAPGLAISIYIFLKDQYNREPRRHLLISFLLGIVSTLIALAVEFFMIGTFDKYIQGSIWGTAVMAYCIVALTEEWSKYIMVRSYAFPKPEFDEPFDGIVYSVMVSMGFATAENIGYVLQYGYGTAVLRMFLSVPAHASFAIIMGYYMGRAKFAGRNRAKLMMAGLFSAIFWHGTYDFFLFLEESHIVAKYVADGLLFLGEFSSFAFAIHVSRNAIKEHVALSKAMHGNTDQV
jgi:RsiW-degrading membrane proteinase PrsW (M82 family)